MESMRESLYRDNLGPYIRAWEEMCAPLADRLSDGRALYVEAHLDAKLRGSFEEAASVLQTSTGAPWMTRNEARARPNLREVGRLDGGAKDGTEGLRGVGVHGADITGAPTPHTEEEPQDSNDPRWEH